MLVTLWRRYQDFSVEVNLPTSLLWLWAHRGTQLVKVQTGNVRFVATSIITPLHIAKSTLSVRGLHVRYLATTPRNCYVCRPVYEGCHAAPVDEEDMEEGVPLPMPTLEGASLWVQIGYFGTDVDLVKWVGVLAVPAIWSTSSRPVCLLPCSATQSPDWRSLADSQLQFLLAARSTSYTAGPQSRRDARAHRQRNMFLRNVAINASRIRAQMQDLSPGDFMRLERKVRARRMRDKSSPAELFARRRAEASVGADGRSSLSLEAETLAAAAMTHVQPRPVTPPAPPPLPTPAPMYVCVGPAACLSGASPVCVVALVWCAGMMRRIRSTGGWVKTTVCPTPTRISMR